ncbi:hypothetical protein HYPSUDRAFT_49349 [Hypholoma sublateritium FD-334 SS-4]|uniref:Uncharacterized protein n=1 Tax=Hypholoma sublateritium (strain FD-334 SS-4) TaxID=945553 RepID=A0A0D2KI30_HYPSF|nr:hypothetical protein HYPSUDRAFT_49349 [Hypholoma sublateritium FD-334 SS-4]
MMISVAPNSVSFAHFPSIIRFSGAMIYVLRPTYRKHLADFCSARARVLILGAFAPVLARV